MYTCLLSQQPESYSFGLPRGSSQTHTHTHTHTHDYEQPPTRGALGSVEQHPAARLKQRARMKLIR
jgi:hypothetical protein